MGIARRGKRGIFQHIRRVPKRYQHIENRILVRTSLHTDDELLAKFKAAQIEMAQNCRWEALLGGKTMVATQQYENLKTLAEAKGVSYLPATQVAELPLGELLCRVELAGNDGTTADAVLGAVDAPRHPLSQLLEIVEDLSKDRMIGSSEEQIYRWRLPRQRAIRNLIKVIGDKNLEDLNRDDGLKFRNWWWKRIETRSITANSANKEMNYLSGMLNTVARMKGLELTNPVSGLRFQATENHRLPFSTAWIRENLLRPGAFAGLNNQARDILLVMVNTGARPSELIGLRPHHIHLDAEIPYIEIRPEGRTLKTKHSERLLPLVGISLEAMKRHPQGFPRYQAKPSNWSNTIGKYLRENKLLETPSHSAYSLRHSLSDRLQNAGCEDRTRKEIMGHRPETVIYGNGASLKVKRDWLEKVRM